VVGLSSDLKFSEEDQRKGKELVDNKRVRSVIFSGGTYQVEVLDEEDYWIFLQIDEEGKLIDRFCTCEEAERKGTCCHLAAGMNVIIGDRKEPLHQRFAISLWNRIFSIAARRHGYSTDVLTKQDGEYVCLSPAGSKHFYLKMKTPEAKEKAQEWIEERKVETEETSLKFSNLDPKELDLWQRGRPSHSLQYELSFWSDLAKWGMLLENRGEKPKITFKDYEEGLPKIIEIQLAEFDVEVFIAKDNWPDLIPALDIYETEINVYSFKDLVIEKIEYHAENKEFSIHSKTLELTGKRKKKYSGRIGFFGPHWGFFRSGAMKCLRRVRFQQ